MNTSDQYNVLVKRFSSRSVSNIKEVDLQKFLTQKYSYDSTVNGTPKDFLLDLIKDIVIDNSGLTSHHIYKMHQHNYYQYAVFGVTKEEIAKDLDVFLYLLRDLICNTVQTFDSDSWNQAIELFDIYKSHFPTDNYKSHKESTVNAAQAAIYIQSLGFKLRSRNGYIVFIENEEDKFLSFVSDQIKAIGGLNLAKAFHKTFLQSRFCERFERFNIYPIFPANGKKSPGVPYSLILNACFLSFTKNKINTYEQDPVKLLQAYSTIEDVEKYHMIEAVFYSPQSFFWQIYKLAVYDRYFKFHQLNINYFKSIIKGIYSWIETVSWGGNLPFTISELSLVFDYIFTNNDFGFVKVSAKEVSSDLKEISLKQVKVILDIFSFKEGTILDLREERIFDKFPLIKHGSYYYSPAPSISAYGVINRLKSYMFEHGYDPNSGIGDKEGNALENFILSKLKESNISFFNGKNYKISKGNIFECDIIIETSKAIIFIEIKKKSITPQGQTGKDLSILKDICQSLRDSHYQAVRSQYYLKRDQIMEFTDNSCLTLNNREIISVSLSLGDFGSFQDNTEMEGVLRILMSYKFDWVGDVSDVKGVREVEVINSKGDKLNDLYKNLVELEQGQNNSGKSESDIKRVCLRRILGNSFFLSINDFLEVLNLSNSNDKFYEILTTNRQVRLGMNDYLSELDYTLTNFQG